MKGETILFSGEELPLDLNNRIVRMVANGEDPTSFLNFYERLQKNPSWRSVKQLWNFLQHEGIPLTKDGCFLAYKGVKSNYKDAHSGKIDNSPGRTNEMPRNQISDDPNEACHEGFHVGALGYARSFSQRVVICKVDPADVVCVPYDASSQKMRVCRYKVVGNYSGDKLPDTTFDDDTTDEVQEADVEERVEEKIHEGDNAVVRNVTSTIEKRASKKGFAKFDKLDMAGLMECSIDELRAYAGKGLEITGASKIPGGKTALVTKILEYRK